ncbi:MAG: hypothetical protein Q9170_001856 [Blastenia crenularia]
MRKSKRQISRVDAGADQNGPNDLPTIGLQHFSTAARYSREAFFNIYRTDTRGRSAGVRLRQRHSSSTPHFAVVVPLTNFTRPSSIRTFANDPTNALLYPPPSLPRPLLAFHCLRVGNRRITTAVWATCQRKLPHSPGSWERMLPQRPTNCCNLCRTGSPRGPQGQDPGGIVGLVQRKKVVNRGDTDDAGFERGAFSARDQ